MKYNVKVILLPIFFQNRKNLTNLGAPNLRSYTQVTPTVQTNLKYHGSMEPEECSLILILRCNNIQILDGHECIVEEYNR